MSLHYLFQQYVLQSVARAAGQVVGIGAWAHSLYFARASVSHLLAFSLDHNNRLEATCFRSSFGYLRLLTFVRTLKRGTFNSMDVCIIELNASDSAGADGFAQTIAYQSISSNNISMDP